MTLELDAFHPDSTDQLSTGKRKPLPEPRPHQVEAIENVISGFQTANRGQLIMPCATGKTLICLWVKEKLKAKRTLVLVPSLGLLSQILSDWTSAARQQFDVLCVCSDQTVNSKDEDEPITLVADLPFPVSSDVSEITDFLRRDDDQVIFSTYQSSPLIAQAQKETNVPHFNLAIADEAHRCAGKAGSVFGTILSERIKSTRRLFTTATPLIYTRGVKKKAKEFGVEVIDMSDERSFGKPFHTLSFSEAIKDKLLTDYRVVIVGVDDERIKEIKEWIERGRLVETDTGLLTEAKSFAASIGVLKAIKDWNLQPQNGYRVISFHGRVKRAREFSEDIIQVAKWLPEEHKPRERLWATYVSGDIPTNFRSQKLKQLKNIGKDEIGFLANARCLSEGVDVPALDAIAFIDPKGSEIDIIQSVGRAIRLSQKKTMGIIIIPVFIGQTDDAQTALGSGNYKSIWNVLKALKSHDDRLSNELNQLRIELGAKRKRAVGANDLKIIHLDLPKSVGEDFAQSFRTRLVENTTEPWMFWYGLLKAFVNEHLHCRVPATYRTDDGYQLGPWINNQRQAKDIMNLDRRQRLEMLPGWSWDILSDWWEEGFSYLKEFVEREGHCRVPQRYKTDDRYQLGQWVVVQRRAKDTMEPDRRQRLQALPRWSWDMLFDQWEEGFSYLKEFLEREGHCRVPRGYKTNDSFRLDQWVRVQRERQAKMNPDRRQRLEALQGWSWEILSDWWEECFSHLKAFVEREGHCRVPRGYKTNDSFRLDQWVRVQRERQAKMNPDRRQRLEALLGWSWDILSDWWEEGFSHLKGFVEREGHCRVPQGYKTEGGYCLGSWVRVQRERQAKDKMNLDRQQRLEALSGWSWRVRSDPKREPQDYAVVGPI
jgi:superfamily II DNA or RNA helicase